MTIRLHVGENLSDPLVTPLTYFGDSLRLWLEGGTDFWEDAGSTDPCEDGDVIEVWSDQSGNGFDTSNSNTPIYDDDALNSIGGAVMADADNDALNISNTAIEATDTEITIFTVFKCTDAANNRQICLYNKAGVACFALQAMGINHTMRFWRNLASGGDEITAAIDPIDFHVVTWWQKEGTGHKAYVDGVEKASRVDANAFASTGWTQEFTIGQDAGGEGAGFTGTIMEYFIVVGPISDADRQVGENYLATKYNL